MQRYLECGLNGVQLNGEHVGNKAILVAVVNDKSSRG